MDNPGESRTPDERDGLTGLLSIEPWLEAVNRMQGPRVVAVFDVCDLAGLNAMFGHGAGDTVLHEVARRLRECLPPGPMARWQGDLYLWAGSVTPLTADRAGEVLREAVSAAQQPIAVRDNDERAAEAPVLLCAGGVLADESLGVPRMTDPPPGTGWNVPDAHALRGLALFAMAQGHAPGTVGVMSVARHRTPVV